ncbi:MAG: toprim domain-containing protein [Methanobrevibacter sp.]|nr:toprim domain-containing protein [Methanobrevibacter sp.]MBO7692127.1 toprim domain-containing protein [Methanobrevibacter sp.]
MFTVSGMPILADEMEVLTELKSQLALNGIYMFKSIKPITNHIQFSCPFHKDGQESKPSCGITTVDVKTGDGHITKAGTVHCFTCQRVCSLEEMISYCFGKNDFGAFGTQWLKKNFLTVQYENRQEIDLDLDRGKKKEVRTKNYVSEEELDSYRYVHPYILNRKITEDVIDFFDVGYDRDFVLKSKNGKEYHLECITFPVRDITGGTLFIARRCITSKLFHYPHGVIKPLYGIYELSLLEKYPDEIIVCESIINCLTCWSYGKYAVALNGTSTPEQIQELKKLPCRKIILGLDPDAAGNRGREKIKKYIGNSKIVTDLIIPEGKDINDLTKEEFDNLKEGL